MDQLDLPRFSAPLQTAAAGDGRNLIAASERLETVIGPSAIAKFAAVTAAGTSPRVYRLSADGAQGEHYVGLGGVVVGSDGDRHTLSVEVKPAGTTRLRIQLYDRAKGGIIGDFDLVGGSTTLRKVGTVAEAAGRIAPAGDWHRLELTTTLGGGSGVILLQLLNGAGQGAFAPAGEAVEMRALRLERGAMLFSSSD